jgi:trehalose/maltose transport system substrate-binding protein
MSCAPEQSNQRYFAYLDLLARRDRGRDILQIDVTWPSALADQLVDLREHVTAAALSGHFPALVANDTVGGRLVAMPWFAHAGVPYYRADLLQKYGIEVPATWSDLADAALLVQEGERAAGNPDFWGLVFQGQAYEGLTCNALEWIEGAGGGRIVADDGAVTINNPAAALALARAAAWGRRSKRGHHEVKQHEINIYLKSLHYDAKAQSTSCAVARLGS